MPTKTMLLKNLAKNSVQLLSHGQFVYSLKTTDRVFFTFDDGPNDSFTPKVLEILRDFGHQATFFLIGEQVNRFPSIARQILSEGHRIGLHTHGHRMLDELNRTEFNAEIRENQEAIANAVGETPTILRPPRGRLRLRNLRWAAQANVRLIHYTITSNDWKAKCCEDVLNAVKLERVRPGDIISFHDNNENTIAALPILLKGISAKGLRSACFPH